jgi:hypothetical protein
MQLDQQADNMHRTATLANFTFSVIAPSYLAPKRKIAPPVSPAHAGYWTCSEVMV